MALYVVQDTDTDTDKVGYTCSFMFSCTLRGFLLMCAACTDCPPSLGGFVFVLFEWLFQLCIIIYRELLAKGKNLRPTLRNVFILNS